MNTTTASFKTPSVFALALIAASFAITAAGQTANPAGMAPDTPRAQTGHPPPEHGNSADMLFTRQVTLGGTQEVELAKLATKRARNQDVKNFAQRMIADHGKANDGALQLARTLAVQPRAKPDMDHAVVRGQLEKLNGDAFDAAYIRSQVIDHQQTAHLLEWEIGSGQDPRVRGFAMQTLPIVLDHLEMAKHLLAQLTGAS